MNLLVDGVNSGAVIKTDRSTKLTVDGMTSTYPIYLVRLDLLYYNDQNDRIATWINQYLTEHNLSEINKADKESYNKVIHEFITLSNPDRIKQTQANIKLVGQQEYGVVLNDGRIIDGNRRFTCLRNLSEESPSFKHFETVILDKEYEENVKSIKMLELQIQIGHEARVDYDPIDRLVGLYRDVVENKLLTTKEYALYTNSTEKDVEKELEIATLIVEFLDTINAPGQFYLARELKLDGPIRELHGVLKKIHDEDKQQQMKCVVFTNFLIKPNDDMTRFTRKMKSIASSRHIDEFIEKEMDIAEQVLDELPDSGHVNAETINDVRANDEVKEKLNQILDKVDSKAKVDETKNKPNQVIIKAIDSIESIDEHILKKLTEEQLEEVSDNLNRLEEIIQRLKETIS